MQHRTRGVSPRYRTKTGNAARRAICKMAAAGARVHALVSRRRNSEACEIRIARTLRGGRLANAYHPPHCARTYSTLAQCGGRTGGLGPASKAQMGGRRLADASAVSGSGRRGFAGLPFEPRSLVPAGAEGFDSSSAPSNPSHAGDVSVWGPHCCALESAGRLCAFSCTEITGGQRARRVAIQSDAAKRKCSGNPSTQNGHHVCTLVVCCLQSLPPPGPAHKFEFACDNPSTLGWSPHRTGKKACSFSRAGK